MILSIIFRCFEVFNRFRQHPEAAGGLERVQRVGPSLHPGRPCDLRAQRPQRRGEHHGAGHGTAEPCEPRGGVDGDQGAPGPSNMLAFINIIYILVTIVVTMIVVMMIADNDNNKHI